MAVVSARPDNLTAYRSQLEPLDRELRLAAVDLLPVLEKYRSRCPDFGADHTALAHELDNHAVQMAKLDGQVGRVGEAFREADRAPGPVPVGVVLTTDAAVQTVRDQHVLDLARRLKDYGDHTVNLPPELVQHARETALRVGISEQLMLMILWQEQQWYQNVDDGDGPVSEFGHFFDWVLRKTVVSDKSLGITHTKLATLRKVIQIHHLTDDQGRDLNSYNNDELAKLLEVNEKFAIDVTALYLSDLQHKDGDWSDKQTFYLYAADSDQVREGNRRYGDSTEDRGGAIRDRGKNWDRFTPIIQDAMEWESLTPEERSRALNTLAAEQPGLIVGAGTEQSIHLKFPYPPPPGVQTDATIRTEPSKSPSPPPTPTAAPPGPTPTPPPLPPR